MGIIHPQIGIFLVFEIAAMPDTGAIRGHLVRVGALEAVRGYVPVHFLPARQQVAGGNLHQDEEDKRIVFHILADKLSLR